MIDLSPRTKDQEPKTIVCRGRRKRQLSEKYNHLENFFQNILKGLEK